MIWRNIRKWRGDTHEESFACDESYHTLRFLVRNADNIPLIALDSVNQSDYLSASGGEGRLLLCHPAANSLLLDTSVWVEAGGERRLAYAIEAISDHARRIILRGNYILMDDVITGGVAEWFPSPSPAFEGLPYAILRALTYATLAGASAASQIPAQIRTTEEQRRAEIALTIQRMKDAGILPVSQEFESIPITNDRFVTLSYSPRAETINLAIAGVPHPERGIDYLIKGNRIEFIGDFASALESLLGKMLEVSYLVI